MEKKVLIVDDAYFMRNYIRGMLEEANFVVCGEASTAPEGVRKYEELKPDLVTMDIVMPQLEELDGISAIKHILHINPQAKIIVVSAIGEDPLIQEALSCGAKGFIVKPFKGEKLIALINQVLQG